MKTEAEVLSALSERLSPGELRQVLSRLLRVPEAWSYLQGDTVIQRKSVAASLASLSPWALAMDSLGLPDSADVTARIPEPFESRMGLVPGEASPEFGFGSDLEAVALAAVWIVRRCAQNDGTEVVSAVTSDPGRWQSPLACAWPQIADQDALIGELTTDEAIVPASFIANVLLTNLSPAEAIETLTASARGSQLRLISLLHSLAGEGAATTKTTFTETAGVKGISAWVTDRVTRSLVEAELERMGGDAGASRSHLDDAWEEANDLLASVSDHIAAAGRQDGESVVEVEARRQALQTHPTPIRRAALAEALIDAGQPEAAITVLGESTSSILEQIAAASAYVALGEKTTATERLDQTTKDLTGLVSLEPQTLRRLAAVARECGRINTAIEIARILSRTQPASMHARLHLASLLNEAGDYLGAARQARLALALEPSSQESLKMLAANLQAGGEPAAALPYWQALAASEPGQLELLAECALASGEATLAEEVARRALEADPQSPNALVLLGRALLALGDPEGARSQIEAATELHPESAEPWIYLAESQAAGGDTAAAGATLSSAAQAVPSSGDLQIAYARWLRTTGRVSEALESTERAVSLSPEQASWQIEQGELLRQLGHTDRALDVLSRAAETWPGSWEARLALALTYESTGRFTQAQGALGMVPAGVSAESRFLAGRLLVEAATFTGGVTRVQEALNLLESSGSSSSPNPMRDLWLGRAMVLGGRPGEAVRIFNRCLPQAAQYEADRGLYLDCVLGLAEAAIADNQPALAVSQLESARSLLGDPAPLLAGLSEAYLAAGLTDQAIQSAEQARAADPHASGPVRRLAKAAVHGGRWETALEALRQLVALEPDQPQARMELARAALHSGDAQLARDSLAAALVHRRRDPHVLRESAALLLELSEAASARRMLSAAAGISVPDPDLLRDLALVSEETGHVETALWAWNARLGLRPDDPSAMKGIATALVGVGRRDEAIAYWEKALSVSPQDRALPVILARELLECGEKQAALRYYEMAIDRVTGDADLALEAGIAQMRFGSPEAALIALEAGSAIAPDRADIQTVMGEAYLRLGKSREALERLLSAAQASVPTPACLGLLSLAHLANADRSAAEGALDRGLRTSPESVDDAVQLSRAALRLAEWDKAIAILETWLSKHDDTRVIVAWIRARLRLADARWLYAHSAEAFAHAPSVAWEGESFMQDMQAGIERARNSKVSEDELARFTQRSLAAAGVAGATGLEDLESWAHLDPSGETSEGLAIAFLRSGRAPDALRTMLPDPRKRPVGEWAALVIGVGQRMMERHEQARQAFSYAASNPVLTPLAQYFAAQAFLDSGMRDKAIAHLNKALASWPDEPAWQFKLAREYQELGQADSALPHLQHAAELSPRNGEYLLALARAYRAADQLAESEDTYARAVHAFPGVGDVWKEAGQLALAFGKAEHAETWFERACSLSPADPHCLVGAARAALALGRARAAREHGFAAQRLAPDDPDVLMVLADVLAAQGKVDKALLAYDRALQLATDPTSVRIARSHLLLRAGRASEAAESLKSLAVSQAENDEIWAALAEAARLAGDLDQAMVAAENASRLAPRNAAYRLAIARISREAGHLDRALSELSQIGAGTSHDPQIAVEIGRLHEDRRELKRALDAYERAIDLDPTNADAHFRAGLVLKGLKAYQQSGAMLKRAAELNPRNPDVLHQLAAVRALELVHGGIRQMAVTR